MLDNQAKADNIFPDMGSNDKKVSNACKRALIKMRNRGWINSWLFYSRNCFTVWFANDLQQKHVKKLAHLLQQCCFECKVYSNSITFNRLPAPKTWPIRLNEGYDGVLKLHLRRLYSPKIRVKKA